MKKLEDFKDTLLFRRKPCKEKGHMLPDGTNPKAETTYRYCVACKCKLPPGVYEFEFNNLQDPPPRPHQKYFTDEERIKARSAASMRWNAKNKDKTKEYVRKYESSGRRQAIRIEKYHSMPADEKEALLVAQRLRNKENYERKKEFFRQNPEAYEAYLAHQREKQRERYNRLKEQDEHSRT